MNPRWRLKQVLKESGDIDQELLEAFGIQRAWLERYPHELSGGELQRFCVARVMASGAKFLICDEISTMLDVITQARIWNVILDLAQKRNMGIAVVTHNPALARRLCSRVWDLETGNYLPEED